MVTFVYLYAFQRYCHFCAPHTTFPTPPLVSPKFSQVPLGLGVGGWPLGYEERRCWAKLSVQLVSKISNLYVLHSTPDPPFITTNVTDGRTTCNRNTALCTIAHRAAGGKNGLIPLSLPLLELEPLSYGTTFYSASA